MAGIQKHREEESVPRLRRYFNSLSSHLATLDSSVRLFGDVIFFIRILGIIAERNSRSSEEIETSLGVERNIMETCMEININDEWW